MSESVQFWTMQQSTIFVELISNRCYGRSVKSKKPKQKTCPLCRNRYCLAISPIAKLPQVEIEQAFSRGVQKAAPRHAEIPDTPPDRIATARQRAEALLQKVTA
jgi:hypothetical protein